MTAVNRFPMAFPNGVSQWRFPMALPKVGAGVVKPCLPSGDLSATVLRLNIG